MGNGTLVINSGIGETRVALLSEGSLAEVFIEREGERSSVGNVYLGVVTRVLPGMQAAFIDIGLDRAAFVHVEDLVPQEDLDKVMVPTDDADAEGQGDDEEEPTNGNAKRTPAKARKVTRATPIRDVVQEGRQLVVQVSKGPIGTKGARATGHVALPGPVNGNNSQESAG